MTEQSRWRLDRTVSVGVAVALAVEAAAGLLWAGRAAARIDAVEVKLVAQASVGERLARLEAVQAAQTAQLGRIEAKLDRR